MSDNKIPLAGVIGNPVAHSLSPRMHGHWLHRMGLPGHYVPLHVASDDLSGVLAALPRMGFAGVNITIPHKEAVLGLADVVSDRAAVIGAANTLTFQKDGRIHADNTDGYGFIQNIRHTLPDWDPAVGPATVIGAGGAARAIIHALLAEGVPELRLTNRTRARSDALRAEFGTRVTVYDWVQAGNAIDGAAFVVNTTSLGMTGNPPFRIPLDGLTPETVVTDIVYAPLETPLLAAARQVGCRTVDGLGMLIWQGVPGFERWFGQTPVVDDAIRDVLLSP